MVIYGGAGLGLLLALWQAGFALRRSVNIAVFSRVVIKLVQADNLDRAIKLCRAVPHAPFALLIREGLEAALEEEDRETRARRMEQAYSHRVEERFAIYGRAKTMALVALGLSVMAVLFGVAQGLRLPYPYGVAAGGGLISLYVLKHILRVRARCDEAFPRIVAAMRKTSE